jgi:ribosomal protein S18 acetylase RimI-like enzyme
MKILTEHNPAEHEIEFLENKLFQYNRRRIDGYEYNDIIFKVVDDANTIIAGIHGQIGGGWLYIASLWVDKKNRNQGIGRKLLIQAQEYAVQKKCVGIYLYTYSFQNPEFYEKIGFHVFGELENFCGYNSKLYMKKQLPQQGGKR